MRIMLVAALAAAVLAVDPSVAASGNINTYSVTIDSGCTTVAQSTWTDGQSVAVIHIGNDIFVTNVAPLNKWIKEAGYFWWLSDVKQPLPPPPEVPATSPLITSAAIKVYVAHGPCGGTPPATTTTTTATATVQKDWLCETRYSKRPLLVIDDTIVEKLKSGVGHSPYWAPGRIAGGINAGGGHLACAVPKGMTPADTYRDGQGKPIGSNKTLALKPGAYPEVREG